MMLHTPVLVFLLPVACALRPFEDLRPLEGPSKQLSLGTEIQPDVGPSAIDDDGDLVSHLELESTYLLAAPARTTAEERLSHRDQVRSYLKRTLLSLVDDRGFNFVDGDQDPVDQDPYRQNRTNGHWGWATARRHSHSSDQEHTRTVLTFLRTAGVLEVCFVIISLSAFLWMYGFFLDWPNMRTRHWAALLVWIVWAGMCLAAVYIVRDAEEATGWLTGYLLELVFSIENVFVFHVVCQAFRAPVHLTQKALYLVVTGQIIFQAIFFMGLAHWLHQSQILPYLLGTWLVYVGFEALRHDQAAQNFDVRDSSAFKVCHAIMGDRLSPEFPQDGHMFFRLADGRTACTMLAPLALCLFVVDALFEVDVTLTKIETLNKDFMCFSSSVVAACAVPELYFVARQVFDKYSLLRYGIAFVLVFYGVQLLLHNLFELPALVGIVFVMAVMGLCMSCSNTSIALKGIYSEGKDDSLSIGPSARQVSGDKDKDNDESCFLA